MKGLRAIENPLGMAELVLPNGARIIARERPTSGVVAIAAVFLVGSRDETPSTEGWANLIARAHLLGTERWPTEDLLRRAVSATGGGISVSGGRELTQFAVTVPSEEFDLAVAVLSEVLNAALFKPDDIARDRGLVLQDIARRRAEPSAIAFDLMFERVWNGHPAGHCVLGSPETLGSADAAALREQRQKVYVGRRLTVAVVGQVESQRALTALASAVGSLPAGAPPSREAVSLLDAKMVDQVERRAGQRQSIVVSGYLTPGRSSSDRYPLLALDAILGSPSGRLFAEIRTRRGLAYSAGSGLSMVQDAGVFYTSAGTEPANADLVLELMLAEVQRLAEESIDPKVLADSIGQLCGRRVMGEETSGALAGQVAAMMALDSWESTEQFQSHMREVSEEDVQSLARRYLNAGRWDIVVRPNDELGAVAAV